MRTKRSQCFTRALMGRLQTDRIFDIADVPFTQVPEEEMKRYTADIKGTGSFRGFKPRELWVRGFWSHFINVSRLMGFCR